MTHDPGPGLCGVHITMRKRGGKRCHSFSVSGTMKAPYDRYDTCIERVRPRPYKEYGYSALIPSKICPDAARVDIKVETDEVNLEGKLDVATAIFSP